MVSLTSQRRLRRWTREEYERMVQAGVLGPEDHVELIEGEILVMSPEKSRHAASIDLLGEALRQAFGDGVTVRIQHPLALGDVSEPEPDVAVVVGTPRDYAAAHPTTALLVVEVADSSLEHDRTTKASLYATAGLEEYWIVNLIDECVERLLNPGRKRPGGREPAAREYGSVTRYARGDALSPTAVPSASIRVADLLV